MPRNDKAEWFHELTHGLRHIDKHEFNEILVSRAKNKLAGANDDSVSLESNTRHRLVVTRNCEQNCFDHLEQVHDIL